MYLDSLHCHVAWLFYGRRYNINFMTIYCVDANENKRKIGHTDYMQDANKIIYNFLKDANYKSFYWNITYIPERNSLRIDVGSHTEFFYIDFLNEKVYKLLTSTN